MDSVHTKENLVCRHIDFSLVIISLESILINLKQYPSIYLIFHSLYAFINYCYSSVLFSFLKIKYLCQNICGGKSVTFFVVIIFGDLTYGITHAIFFFLGVETQSPLKKQKQKNIVFCIIFSQVICGDAYSVNYFVGFFFWLFFLFTQSFKYILSLILSTFLTS